MADGHNNVIIDFDFICDKEVALFDKYLKDKLEITTDQFVYIRSYVDPNINPLKHFLDENVSDNYFKEILKNDELYKQGLFSTEILNMVDEYANSQYITVTIAYGNDVEKDVILELFGDTVNTAKRSITSPIDLKLYDTIFIPNYNYFQFYNFENKERMNIYIYNHRSNFYDDKKEVLDINYLGLGMANDIYTIPIYKFE